MKKLFTLLVLLCLVVGVSCKKEVAPEANPDPVEVKPVPAGEVVKPEAPKAEEAAPEKEAEEPATEAP